MIIQKSFLFLIIFIITFCIAFIDSISAQTENDSLHKEIKHLKNTISKLDSTITKLQNENQTILTLTEKDINTAQNLINVSQTVTEIIAVMLAIFSVIGGFLISRLMKQSRQVRKEHRILKKDWNTTRTEIEKIKDTLIRDSKELVQILFYVTEGDTRLKEKTEESIEFYKEALKISEDNSEVYAKLGRAYSFLGQYSDAILNYEKGLHHSPNNTLILNGLASNYEKMKRYGEAEEFYKKTLDINKNNNRALWGLGHLYILKREFDKAELFYKKSQLTDDEYFSNFNLAYTYACKKDINNFENYAEKTLELINKRISNKTASEWALARKALLLLVLQEYDDAKKIILNLMQDYNDSLIINYMRDRLKILNEVYNDKIMGKMIETLTNSIE